MEAMKAFAFCKRILVFDVFICLSIEAYFFLFIHSLAESYGEFPTPSYTFSYVLATISFFGLIILMFFIPKHYCRTRDKKPKYLVTGMCRVFYLGLKKDRAWAALLYLGFGSRRFLLSLLIVFYSLTLTFYFLMGSILLIHLIYAGYLVWVRPYEKIIDNVLAVLSELPVILVVIYMMCLDTEKEWTKSKGISLLSLIFSIGVIIVLIQLLKFVLTVIGLFRNRGKSTPHPFLEQIKQMTLDKTTNDVNQTKRGLVNIDDS